MRKLLKQQVWENILKLAKRRDIFQFSFQSSYQSIKYDIKIEVYAYLKRREASKDLSLIENVFIALDPYDARNTLTKLEMQNS